MTTPSITLRDLDTMAEFEACEDLQRATWGRDFGGVVPASLLLVANKIGGLVAGAFDERDGLAGFVFGLTGYRDGRPLHWSHMLAVRDTARDFGIGLRLKLYQRERLLAGGVHVARWTYDPLVAKNAHLNLNRLGAVVLEYVEDMYGESHSPLHEGLGTDRFVVEWRLTDGAVQRRIAGREAPNPAAYVAAPVVNRAAAPPRAPRVRVEIPADVHEVRARSAAEAAAWRAATRRAFAHYLAAGYRVTGFHRDPGEKRCYYALATAAEPG